MNIHVENFELVQSVSPDPTAVLIRTDALIHRKTRDLTDRQFGLLVRLWIIALKYGNDFDLSDYFKPNSSSLKDLSSLKKKNLIQIKEGILKEEGEHEREKETFRKIQADRTAIHDRVLGKMNELTGRTGKERFTKSEDLLKRVREGMSEQLLIAVTMDRVSAWHGDPEMQQWLKPSTIFRPSNFKRYAEDMASSAPDSGRKSIFARSK